MGAAAAVTFYDEAPGSGRTKAFRLELVAERLTARELIARRVRAEVEQQCAAEPREPRAERLLNKPRVRARPDFDWQAELDRALGEFERSRIVLLVDDRQVESLDEELTLGRETDVCFLRLVPLVGG